ncbi:MAG TPA: FAD-dependent monooxygenase [Candidatus Angelobacter sp.]|nr:FAD-dependent monooxygenase [Candidatus Angelobacter sp.]
MQVIVIGGGIGGLTATIALRRAGIEAHAYERAPALREVGAGISLWANALHALDELGLANAIRPHVLSELHAGLRTWRGAVLSSAASNELTKRFAVPIAVMHRADLLAVLAGQVSSQQLHFDHECTGFVQDAAGVTARFTNGKVVRGDVLIGADGLRSVVRAQLFGDQPPRYAGYTAWRAIVPTTHTGIASCESWGPGQRFGIIPLGDGRVYWYATKNLPEGQRDEPGQAKQNLLRLFRGWHDPVEALIQATDESAILRNDIYDRDPLPRWSENRVTLLGDAAHPMTPNLGQGGCQAIEDAVVLAACLANSHQVDSALRRYQDRRIPRTSAIVLQSRRIGEIGQWENLLLCFLRNAAIRAVPSRIKARQIASVAVYEALTEAERALFANSSLL